MGTNFQSDKGVHFGVLNVVERIILKIILWK